MGLINYTFSKDLDNRYLTENVSLFLYSLIRCCRPVNLLEIGAGYSTAFLAQALEDVKNDKVDIKSKWYLNSKYWNNEYSPKLEVIENEEMGSSLKKITNFLKEQNLEENVKIINRDLYDYVDILKTQNKTYDFIWMDYGSGENYLRDFEIFENLLNPNGIIVVHSTLTNVFGKMFLSEMKLQTKIGKYSHLEMISFLEPHKGIQNSFTVFKKITDYPTYSISS